MKKILAFAGSNSSISINHQLVDFVATQIVDHHVNVIKLTDYPLEMFSEDLEKEQGFSTELRSLHELILESDALIISVNEHNSGVSAFFKNTTDWLSRLDKKFLENKKVLLLATSPGGRGAISALEFTKNSLPRFGADIIESFSFPKFHENFSKEEQKINDVVLEFSLKDAIQNFVRRLESNASN